MSCTNELQLSRKQTSEAIALVEASVMALEPSETAVRCEQALSELDQVLQLIESELRGES